MSLQKLSRKVFSEPTRYLRNWQIKIVPILRKQFWNLFVLPFRTVFFYKLTFKFNPLYVCYSGTLICHCLWYFKKLVRRMIWSSFFIVSQPCGIKIMMTLFCQFCTPSHVPTVSKEKEDISFFPRRASWWWHQRNGLIKIVAFLLNQFWNLFVSFLVHMRNVVFHSFLYVWNGTWWR